MGGPKRWRLSPCRYDRILLGWTHHLAGVRDARGVQAHRAGIDDLVLPAPQQQRRLRDVRGLGAWLACANLPQVRAGVAWYGRLVGDKSENFPAHPVDLAQQLKAPVLGLYGGKDTGIALDTVDLMKQALAAAKDNKAAAGSRFEIYPDAPHAFHADYRPTYQAGPARDGWEKCLQWFKTHGV